MEAFRFQEASRLLADSLAKLNTFRAITETEHRIKTKRENEILLVKNLRQAEERNLAIILGIASVLVLGGIGGTLYFRNRARFTRRLLEESERTSRAVVQATFNGMEKERKRVQRELHDGVQSKLVAAKIAFSSLEGVVAEQAPQRAVDFMRTLNGFGSTISEISAIAQNLIPANLEAAGLAVAIEDFISAMRPTMPLTEILLNVEDVRTRRFAPDRELSVYRLVQEIVNNCRKHAEAESLVLDFILEKRVNAERGSNEEEWLVITGEDEGRGFSLETPASAHIPSQSPKRGLGLSTMQNRVHALGGTITIDSTPQRGTCIVAAIPLEI
jgi:signal transduction histidine kinase